MSVIRHAGLIILAATVLIPAANAARKNARPYTIEEFASTALAASLRSQTNEDNFSSSRYNWMASRRGLSWPTVSLTASDEKAGTDSDTGITTDTEAEEAGITLSQPFLTASR